jgi:hypothetical protein
MCITTCEYMCVNHVYARKVRHATYLSSSVKKLDERETGFKIKYLCYN